MSSDNQQKRLDVMLVLPPQWTALSPYYALPVLAGEIKANGYSCNLKDLNLEFFNNILTPEYLSWCRIAVNKRHEELGVKFINKIADYGVDAFDSSENLYHEIEEKIERYELYWDHVVNNITKAKEVLRDKSSFYDPQKVAWSFNILIKGLEIASLPYFPSNIMLRNFKNRNHSLTMESVVEAVDNDKENPFLHFYEMAIPSILEANPKLIGISINAFSQVVSGLTLSKMLKERMPDTHICIGGNFFTRVIETLKDKPEFFETFCDSLIYEEGEIPNVKLIEVINNGGDLSEVPNLIYLDGDKVKITDKCAPKKLNEIADPDMEGLDLNAYLTPEIVMPIQASRGCYWGKCTFCDHDYGAQYNLKSIDKLISEIKIFKEKYGITHFEFIDESISPSYMKKMSEAFIENDLNIKWFMYGRTEKGFTQELMDLAFKSGCRMIMWGVESGSKRIMDLINKGIDFDNRFEPLKKANNAGIWNYCFTFFGFPTETSEEAMETINMIIENRDIINSYGMSTFGLGKHTLIREEPTKFGIANIREAEEDLSTMLHYDITKGMEPYQIIKAAELCNEIAEKVYQAPLWFSIGFREFLHLYIDHYGLEYVKKYSYWNASSLKDVKKWTAE